MMFPLPDVVLFPHTQMPLHIFEPRYREMVQRAIDLHLPIAMGTIRPETDRTHPSVHDVLGVGFVTEHEQLEDGRYVILLEGVSRVKLEYEHQTEDPFRTIRASLIDDLSSDFQELATTLFAIRTVIRSLHHVNAHLSEFLQAELETCEDAIEFGHRVGGMICTSLPEKLDLIREIDPSLRLDFVLTRLSELMVQTDTSVATN